MTRFPRLNYFICLGPSWSSNRIDTMLDDLVEIVPELRTVALIWLVRVLLYRGCKPRGDE